MVRSSGEVAGPGQEDPPELGHPSMNRTLWCPSVRECPPKRALSHSATAINREA
jgi:hypothetical protein